MMPRRMKEEELFNINRELEKPPIPKLPKTRKKLIILANQRFKTLQASKPVSATHGGEYHPGDIAMSDLELECPFCGMKFKGMSMSGCFSHQVFPHTCPNCTFPNNVFKALRALMEKNRKM